MDKIITNDSTLAEIRKFLLRAHYHLMDNPRFWYENGLKDASRLFCTRASDLNVEILNGN